MNKLGPLLALCSALFMGWFMHATYPRNGEVTVVAEVGYTPETRARMDDLIAGLTPLTVADLGE